MGTDNKEEMFEVKLRATRTVVRPTGKKRLDGMQTTVPSLAKAGDVGLYNGNSYAVQIYALGGALEPVDKDAKKWLAAVQVDADKVKG